jgi:hypothetical protein
MSYTVTGSQPLSPDACKVSPELKAVQSLMPMAAEDRATLRESIKRDGIREPLRGYFDESGDFLILSGLNRLEIAKELKLPLVLVQSVETDDRESFAVDENRARRQLKTEDKKRLAEWWLKRHPEYSDREIGKRSGIDHKTVNTVRAQAERRGEIPHTEKRTDSKGRKQAASKPKQARNRHPEPTGKAQKGTKAQGNGQGRGDGEAALRAFSLTLNDALKKVEMQPASVLKIAVRHAKSWLKDVERKHKAAERAK